MDPKTVDECLKEYFKTAKRYPNKVRVWKARFLTGKISELSKRNLLLSLGYKVYTETLYIIPESTD